MRNALATWSVLGCVLSLLAGSPCEAKRTGAEAPFIPASPGAWALGPLRVATFSSEHGTAIRGLTFGSGPLVMLSYEDTVLTRDQQYMGAPRPSLFPGAPDAVLVFAAIEVSPSSPLRVGACKGPGSVKFAIYQAGGELALGTFDEHQPIKVFILTEALRPEGVRYALCQAVDYKPST